MIFEPMNKLVLVEKMPTKKTKTIASFVVPEESMQPRYSVVKVLRASGGNNLQISDGDLIVVQTALIDEVEFDGNKFHVVTESGIVGRLKENQF
jgi:co-chaperonin GroES (HSP10)